MSHLPNHIDLMRRALEMARVAMERGEVPVGAVIADSGGSVVAEACNLSITLSDPTAHAEILAIRKAAEIVGNYRLTGAALYVTLEPCIMCMGAIIHARIRTVVFGASDPKWGAAGSLYELQSDERLNHSPSIVRGVLEEECGSIIRNFFRKKREKKDG